MEDIKATLNLKEIQSKFEGTLGFGDSLTITKGWSVRNSSRKNYKQKLGVDLRGMILIRFIKDISLKARVLFF